MFVGIQAFQLSVPDVLDQCMLCGSIKKKITIRNKYWKKKIGPGLKYYILILIETGTQYYLVLIEIVKATFHVYI